MAPSPSESEIVNYLVPIAIFAGLALVAGGKPRRRNGGPRIEPMPGDDTGGPLPPDELPISDRMLFDEDCYELIVRVNSVDYDYRITNRYWQLRQAGVDDPNAITADILAMDAPQCVWPPVQGQSSPTAIEIWNGTLAAVEAYHNAVESGTLGEFDSVFGLG